MTPLKSMTPETVALIAPFEPVRLTGLARVIAEFTASVAVVAPNETVPVPKALAFPAVSVPAEIVVTPV